MQAKHIEAPTTVEEGLALVDYLATAHFYEGIGQDASAPGIAVAKGFLAGIALMQKYPERAQRIIEATQRVTALMPGYDELPDDRKDQLANAAKDVESFVEHWQEHEKDPIADGTTVAETINKAIDHLTKQEKIAEAFEKALTEGRVQFVVGPGGVAMPKFDLPDLDEKAEAKGLVN